MGETELFQQLQLVAPADAPCSGAPFADAVESEDGSFGKGAGEEGTGCVAFVMFEKHQFSPMCSTERVADGAGLMQLFLQPERDSFEEAAKSEGGKGKVCFEQSVKFGQWFFVEGDVVEVAGGETGLFEAAADGLFGKGGVMFATRESLFLCGCNQTTVDKECGSAVVVECGYAEDSSD